MAFCLWFLSFYPVKYYHNKDTIHVFGADLDNFNAEYEVRIKVKFRMV